MIHEELSGEIIGAGDHTAARQFAGAIGCWGRSLVMSSGVETSLDRILNRAA
jgi:hypothetical protein